MAIISCPECGKQISDKAYHCIHCGCPIATSASNADMVATVSSDEQPGISVKNFFDFKKIIKNMLTFVKTKKKIIAVISIILIIATILSTASPLGSKLSSRKITLDKVYKAGNVAEFTIKRVAPNKVLSTEKNDNETFVDFFCKFTNISDTEYDDEDVITAYATGVKSKAKYTNSYIRNTDNGMVITHDIQSHVTKTMHIAVAVPVDESEIIFTIKIKDYVFNFDYKMGDIYRNAEYFEIGNTCKTDDVAEIKINNIVYTSEASALAKMHYTAGFSSISPENSEEVFLLVDMTYTNLKTSNSSGIEDIDLVAIYDNKYVYNSFDIYDVSSIKTWLTLLYDREKDFIPHGSARFFALIKVSKEMMENEVELDFFIGEKEFIYNGKPNYIDFYPKDREVIR